MPTLDTLVRLEAAATKGPWIADTHKTERHGGRAYAHLWGHGPTQIGAAILGAEGCSQDEGRANAALIVALRNSAPALLACARALEPFAREAALYAEHVPDALVPTIHCLETDTETPAAYSVGDLRAAAQALADLEAGNGG